MLFWWCLAGKSLTSRWLPSLLLPHTLFIVPGAVTLGALLCCAKGQLGSGLPSLWERASFGGAAPIWGFHGRRFSSAAANLPKCVRWRGNGWGIGWHMSRYVPAALGGRHASVPASGQHFPRDGLPVQNKLELWIYSACKTSAGINNWESKGLSVVHTSGTRSCLPPSHHPFLWKWSQLHW